MHAVSIRAVSLSTLAVALLSAAAVPAQDRVVLDGQGPRPAATSHVLAEPPPITATGFSIERLDDEPDFAPMEDVRDKDGHVIETRRVGNPYVLAFTAGSFAPERGVDARLEAALRTRPESHTFGFVMIRGRMSDEKRTRLRDAGVELFGIHTYQSIRVRIDAAALARVRGLPFVHWIGYAKPEQKVDHNFAPALARATMDQKLQLTVAPFTSDLGAQSRRVVAARPSTPEGALGERGAAAVSYTWLPNGPFHQRLAALGFGFEHYDEFSHSFVGSMTKRQVLALLQEDFVHAVGSPPGVAVPEHDQTMAQMGQDYVRKFYPGTGVQVGIIDSGVDSTPWHKDFFGMHYVFWGRGINPNPAASIPWHGTHVTGTILGSGSADSKYRGCAPNVGRGGATNRVFLSDYGTLDSSNLAAFGTSYTDKNGKKSERPSIINCSYSRGASSSGYFGTDSNTIAFDNAVYAKRQLYVFAAGNKRSSQTNFWGSRPGVGKNVLTVGSVIDRFNAARTTNPGHRSTFSRWGTRDFRTKPEICAPGDQLTSCDWNTSTGYRTTQGTSMSTPMVTGALASRIDRSSWYAYRPEALKAIAVASAKNRNKLNSGVWSPPQPGATNRQTTGWGLINSKTMTFPTSETQAYIWGGTFTRAGQSYVGSFTVPSNAQRIRMVLCYTEKGASTNATKARLNDLRAHFDFAPYTTNNSSGDYTAQASFQTVIVRDNIPVAASQRGTVARVKVRAASLPSPNAYWSVVIMVYRKTPNVAAPLITVAGQTYVKPSTPYTLVGTMRSPAGFDGFRSGRLWYDGDFDITGITRILDDGGVQNYTSANSHWSAAAPRVGKGGGNGITVGSGTQRAAFFKLVAPATNGMKNLYVRGTWGSSISPAPFLSTVKQVCVDGLAPNTISGLTSTSHTAGQWSNKNDIAFLWSTPTDVGCSGIHGLAYHVDKSNNTNPGVIDALGAKTSYAVANLGDSAIGWYFHVRPRDRASNYGATAHIGPFKIDTGKPVLTSVVLANGAATTSSLSVKVGVTAGDGLSGLATIRYSAAPGTWSTWMKYSASRIMNLTTIGATTAAGVKSVTVQVRDQAGNLSGYKADTITYFPAPVIKSITASLANNTKRYYEVKGSGLDKTVQVKFGTTVIANKWSLNHEDKWFAGRFRVVSATELRVYPPQSLPPGSYSVSVKNGLGASSNTVGTKVLLWLASNNLMHTEARIHTGMKQHIQVSRGNNPIGTSQLTMVSGILKPSAIPGFIKMDIGANWTNYFLLPRMGFSASTGNSVFSVVVPAAAKGVTLYYQTLFIHPNGSPLGTSAVRRTIYL